MDDDNSVYELEHLGLLKVDKILLVFCCSTIPALLTILASRPIIPMEANMWLVVLIISNPVALFCLLWHSFRWPVRLRTRRDITLQAWKDFTDEFSHIVDTEMRPAVEEAVCGKNDSLVVKGPDGKEYIPGPKSEMIKKVHSTAFAWMNPNNPSIRKVFNSNIEKISQAYTDPSSLKLTERYSRQKHFIDYLARYLRYPVFFINLISAAIFAYKFLE